MKTIVGIQFKGGGRVYYFDPLNFDFKRGDYAIVETVRGLELGYVSIGNRMVEDDQLEHELKPVIRIATERDLKQEKKNNEQAKNSFEIFKKYGFDEQVMIALFDYCYNRSAMHRNYVQTVAEAWGNNKIKTWTDLETYSQQEDKLLKIKKLIAKKLGKHSGLTQYEEAYIESWVLNYGYDMDIIEIALKRTTYKQNPTFEYINNIISDWHERNLKTPAEVTTFIEQRNKQTKDVKNLKQSVSKANYAQRQYDNLDFLYANNNLKGDSNV